MIVDVHRMQGVSEAVIGELKVALHQLPSELVTAAVREAERDLAGQVALGSLGELLTQVGRLPAGAARREVRPRAWLRPVAVRTPGGR